MGGITYSSPCSQVHTVGRTGLPINFRARTRANSDFRFSESRNTTLMSKAMSVYLYEGLLFWFFWGGGCWFIFCAIATSCTEFKSNFILTGYRNKFRELKLVQHHATSNSQDSKLVQIGIRTYTPNHHTLRQWFSTFLMLRP